MINKTITKLYQVNSFVKCFRESVVGERGGMVGNMEDEDVLKKHDEIIWFIKADIQLYIHSWIRDSFSEYVVWTGKPENNKTLKVKLALRINTWYNISHFKCSFSPLYAYLRKQVLNIIQN